MYRFVEFESQVLLFDFFLLEHACLSAYVRDWHESRRLASVIFGSIGLLHDDHVVIFPVGWWATATD